MKNFLKFIGVWFLTIAFTGGSLAGSAPNLRVAGAARVGSLLGGEGGGGGGCTVASGDVFNEGFEGTGYDEVGSGSWSETTNPDEDVAIPSSPCSGLGSQALRSNVSTSTSYTTYNVGSGTTSDRYFRCYVYLDSTDMAVDNNVHIIHCQSSGGTRAFTVRWTNVTGQGYGFDMIGTTFSANIGGAQLDTWYRVEVKWVNNNAADATELKVYTASTGVQLGSTVTVDTGNVSLQHYILGVFSNPGTKAYDFYYDGFGVSSTGYLGQ